MTRMSLLYSVCKFHGAKKCFDVRTRYDNLFCIPIPSTYNSTARSTAQTRGHMAGDFSPLLATMYVRAFDFMARIRVRHLLSSSSRVPIFCFFLNQEEPNKQKNSLGLGLVKSAFFNLNTIAHEVKLQTTGDAGYVRTSMYRQNQKLLYYDSLYYYSVSSIVRTVYHFTVVTRCANQEGRCGASVFYWRTVCTAVRQRSRTLSLQRTTQTTQPRAKDTSQLIRCAYVLVISCLFMEYSYLRWKLKHYYNTQARQAGCCFIGSIKSDVSACQRSILVPVSRRFYCCCVCAVVQVHLEQTPPCVRRDQCDTIKRAGIRLLTNCARREKDMFCLQKEKNISCPQFSDWSIF